MMTAEADGLRAILTRKAEGFAQIVESAESKAELAALLLITEQMPKLVEEQVKAISNLKIDQITVWEGGRKGDGKTDTANFVSGLVGALPPLHEITRNVGIQLPAYLGKLTGGETPGAGASGSDAEEPGAAKPERSEGRSGEPEGEDA